MINRVVLVGRLTKDPVLKQTQSGISVATFNLAVNRTFTNQAGEREADFVPVVVWRKQAENVAQYVGKGSLVGIEGRLQTRTYEAKDGNTKFVMEVIADSVQFLESKNSNHNQQQNNNYTPQQTSFTEQSNQNGFTGFEDDNSFDISDRDLPF